MNVEFQFEDGEKAIGTIVKISFSEKYQKHQLLIAHKDQLYEIWGHNVKIAPVDTYVSIPGGMNIIYTKETE